MSRQFVFNLKRIFASNFSHSVSGKKEILKTEGNEKKTEIPDENPLLVFEIWRNDTSERRK